MSESSQESVITEEDLENDGFVVRESGSILYNKLAMSSQTLMQMFENYCDKIGRDPRNLLGEFFLRALQEDSYNEVLMAETVDIAQLNADNIRKEDAELVTDLAEELGISGDSDGEEEDIIREMIKKRISAVGRSPFSQIGESKNKNRDVKRLEQKVDRMEDMLYRALEDNEGGSTPETNAKTTNNNEEGQDVEELFDDDGEEEESEIEEDVEGEIQEIETEIIEEDGEEENMDIEIIEEDEEDKDGDDDG